MVEIIVPVFYDFIRTSKESPLFYNKDFKVSNIKKHIITNVNIRSKKNKIKIFELVWGSYFKIFNVTPLEIEEVYIKNGNIFYVEVTLGY